MPESVYLDVNKGRILVSKYDFFDQSLCIIMIKKLTKSVVFSPMRQCLKKKTAVYRHEVAEIKLIFLRFTTPRGSEFLSLNS